MKTSLTRLAILLLLSLTTPYAHAQWSGTGDIYYNNGNVGIGTTSPLYPLVVAHSPYSIGTSGTNYKIGTEIKIFDTYNIPNGMTESGYRMGLNIAAHISDVNFLGTLSSQYGVRIQHGTYNGSGAGSVVNSYGLFLQGLDGGSASITNKYAIYQSGGDFKNFFQGFVGIGTNAPTELLSLYKYQDDVKIRLQNSSTSWRLVNDVNAKFIINGQWSGDVFIIDDTSGNVGIGTISPEYKLDVSTSLDGLGGLRINNNNYGANTKSGINIKQGSNDMANIFARRNNNEFVFQNNQTVSTAGFTFLNGSISALRINSNGNIGIGTTTPSNKLDVAGTIRAEEVKVETGWADYVFHEDYELKSLSEVSTYIQENHHLPGIPTAEEVAENGIKLGEMNAKLLEKVEELTLYLIEQNSQLQKQNKKIEAVLKENDEMRTRLEKLEKVSEP